MRLTTASVAAVILIAAGIFTFWPGNNAGPGAATLVAQAPDATPADAAQKAKPAGDQKKAASIKDILERRMAFVFDEEPLKLVAYQLSEQTGITIYLDAKRLEEAGVNIDTPVIKTFRDMRLRTFLDLMLGELELTYLVKDDVLFITTPEYAESPDSMIVRVYDCRELLALPRPPGSTRPKAPKMGGGGGFFAVQDEPVRKPSPAGSSDATTPPEGSSGGSQPSAAQNAPHAGGFGSAAGGLPGDESPGEELSDAENLIRVITTTVDPGSWHEVGGPGGIAEYKGLLTVVATQAVHEKVERLLNMLHQAGNLKELKVTVVE